MKHLFVIINILVCIIIATLTFHLTRSKESSSEKRNIIAVPYAIGTKDDPNARANWEWMRLRDPVTNQIPSRIREKELAFAASLPTKESTLRSLKSHDGKAVVQTNTWVQRGPYNVGGRTRALAIDVSNSNVLLAGGISGGMWRSTDDGTTWTRTTSLSDSSQSVTCLAQDTRSGKTNIWYHGTGEILGNSAGNSSSDFYRGDGIYKSTNSGVTWFVLPATKSGTPQLYDGFDHIWNIVLDPSNSSQDEVYAATPNGIKRSTNGGTSWTTELGYLYPAIYADVAITTTGLLYATQSTDQPGPGIYRSTNGTSWTNITPSGFPGTYNRIVIAIAPSNENIVYFLAETPGSGTNNHSLWKYTDNGSGTGTWNKRSANIPMYGDPVGNFDSQGSYDLVIKVKPDNSNVVFIGGTNLYRSTDGFASGSNTSWIGGYATDNDISKYPNHHPDIHAITFVSSNPSVLYAGDDGGVQKTTNCLANIVVWTELNNGYTTSQYYSIALDHATSGNNIVIGGLQDNGTWFTNSLSPTAAWKEIGSGDGTFCAIADGRSSYYVGVQNGLIIKEILNDNGVESNWTRVDPTGGNGYMFVAPYLLDPNNTNSMYLAGGQIVWRNNDLTAIPFQSNNTTSVNWDSISNTRVSNDAITALGISKTSANRLYYGTYYGNVYRLNNAHTGNPFPTNVTGSNFPSAYVSSIAVDQTNADKVVVVFSNYGVKSLFYTTNGGTSWTDVSGNLEENANGTGRGPSCRWASILPYNGTTNYFVGTSIGLYSTSSLNGSSTVWMQEGNSVIGNVVVDMMDVRASDGLVVAATHGNGVFSSNVSSSGSSHELVYDDGSPTGGYYWNEYDQGSATRITPTLTPAKVLGMKIYFTGVNSGSASYIPIILSDYAGAPGSDLLYLTPTTASTVPGWDMTDLSSANIIVSNDFYVGLIYDGVNKPSFGYDATNNGRAWDFDGSDWSQWNQTYFMRATISTVTSVVEIDTKVPKEFILEQNFPNPFNPSTQIRYALPKGEEVSITIYDLSGRQVTVLVNNNQNAGTYEIDWNGKNDEGIPVSSGVYLYTINAGDVRQSRKMILMR